MVEEPDDPETAALAAEIRKRRTIVVRKHRAEKGTSNRPVMPRSRVPPSAESMRASLGAVGVDATAAIATAAERSGRKRHRSISRARRDGPEGRAASASAGGGGGGGDVDMAGAADGSRSRSRSRSRSVAPRDERGLDDPVKRARLAVVGRKQEKEWSRYGMQGPADRFIGTKKPQHLFSGKRGFSADRR